MSTEERPNSADRPKRRPRRPETPKNNPQLGAILVGAAAFIGLLLFIAGGGGSGASNSSTDDQTTPTDQTDESTPADPESSSSVPANTVPLDQLSIISANGAGTPGLAGDTADILTGAGYTNVKAVDGTSTATTQVYFVAGSDNDAAAIVDLLRLSIDRLVPMPDAAPLVNAELGDAKILVLLGADFNPEIVKAAIETDAAAAAADG